MATLKHGQGRLIKCSLNVLVLIDLNAIARNMPKIKSSSQVPNSIFKYVESGTAFNTIVFTKEIKILKKVLSNHFSDLQVVYHDKIINRLSNLSENQNCFSPADQL